MSSAQALPTPLARALAAGLDRVLALDSAAEEALKPLDGRVMQVNLTGPDWVVWLRVEDGRVVVLDQHADTADTTITGSPLALFGMALPGSETRTGGNVRIEGDAETARQLNRLFKQLDPDWDEALASTFGDVLGHQLGRALRGGFSLAKRVANTLGQNASEYLREEVRVLITQVEMDEFIDEVEDLRDDIDRLEARLDRLASGS
ncbi:MAG: sterol-binding protein [Lysobacteraceae bacterium]|nr:MAG: sterol-binding protein [Xanthomonadaceae bacterium]